MTPGAATVPGTLFSMVLFHGTNISHLKGGKLGKRSWLSSDIYQALGYAEARTGESFVYVFWLEEKDIEFVYQPNGVLPAYVTKEDQKPIGRLMYDGQKLKP